MRQVNIVGTSPPSQPSRKIETLQAPPDIAPANVTLRTASETSLWLRWVVSFLGGRHFRSRFSTWTFSFDAFLYLYMDRNHFSLENRIGGKMSLVQIN